MTSSRKFTLGWSHYVLLMRIIIEEKRKFEKEKLLALAVRKGGGA